MIRRAARRRSCKRLREQPVQEPLAVIGSVPMVAIDPDDFALRILADEIIAAAIAAAMVTPG